MKLGTGIPYDEPTQVNGVFNLDKALGCLSSAGIRGCLTGFVGGEAHWENSTRDLGRALQNAGVELLEYNTPFLIEVFSREQCKPTAHKIVRLLELSESIGCLNVVTCVAGPNSILPNPWNRSQECRDLLKETCDIIAEESARKILKARLLLELVYTTIVWSPLALARLLDEIDSPNVQGHMDLANCLTFDNIYDHAEFTRDAFTILGDRIYSAHIKDVAPSESYFAGLTECMVGDGVMDYRTYLDCLSMMPQGFPALIEHISSMADIERSYNRIKAIADEMNIPVWS